MDVYGTLKIRASVADVNSVRKQPAPPKPKQAAGGGKIIIYGRDGCGWCKKIKGDFDQAGLAYSFVSCDNDDGNREMWGFL